jgi:hypothetical protein
MGKDKKPSKPVKVKPLGHARGTRRVQKEMVDVKKK